MKTLFLTKEDFRVVIGEGALAAVTQAEPGNVARAMREAIEEIAGYLRPTYDCAAIFSAVGTERNPLIVMYTADIALYHLVSSMPQKMGYDIRKERYDRAITWLEGVQSGDIIPDLPLMTDSDGNDIGGTRYASQKKLHHNW